MKYLTFGSTTAVTAVTVKTTSAIQQTTPTEVNVIENEERRILLFKVQQNMFSTLELNDTHR